MKNHKKVKALPLLVAVGLTAVSCASLINLGHASAVGAAMTQTLVRSDRLAFSVTTGGRVCAKPLSTAGAVEAKVQVTFPTNAATDYALSATLSAWAATGVTEPSLGATTAWPGLSATNWSSLVTVRITVIR